MKQDVPYIPQGNPCYCVAACFQMVLGYYNVDSFYNNDMNIRIIFQNQQKIAERLGIKFKPYAEFNDCGLVLPDIQDVQKIPFIKVKLCDFITELNLEEKFRSTNDYIVREQSVCEVIKELNNDKPLLAIISPNYINLNSHCVVIISYNENYIGFLDPVIPANPNQFVTNNKFESLVEYVIKIDEEGE